MLQKFNHIIVVSSTGDIGGNYNYVDQEFVYLKYSKDLLKQIIKIQKNSGLLILLILDIQQFDILAFTISE
jgi:hypothetical protein